MVEDRSIDPSGPHVVIGGEQWYEFTIDYSHKGVPFTFNIHARSWDEAESMLVSIQHNGRVDGQVVMSGKIVPGFSWMLPMTTWLRNAMGIHPMWIWMALAVLFFVLLLLK